MSGQLISEHSGIEYRIITQHDTERLKDVVYYYLRTEPGARSVDLTEHDMSIILDLHEGTTFVSGLSIAAVDTHTNKIIGARLSVSTKRNDDVTKLKLFHTYTPALTMLERVWRWLKVDVYELYPVESCVVFWGLMVLEEYSGKGIGRRLCTETVKLMEQRAFPMIASYASNVYTRRIYHDLGFESLQEIGYDKIEEDVPEMGDTGVNKVLSFHVKKLSAYGGVGNSES